MFVRKKKNKSGVVSIQIIDKSSGIYEHYRTVGSSSDALEVKRLYKEAKREIERISGQQKLSFDAEKEKDFVDTFFHGIEDFKLVGPERVLGKLFDEIGFNKIPEELFRHLVITRLVYPVSKLKTVDYLFKYKGETLHIQNIYRYLDKLNANYIEQVQQISYDHTLKILNGDVSIVFYDVTTLYFETSDEDDLRKTGFSKDGKHQQPQILLGLLVSKGGYPLAYEVFEGSAFEGHTMIPVIEAFRKKYQIEKLVVIADSGLLSAKNVQLLVDKNYEFILGGRIKNESRTIQQQVLALRLEDGQSSLIDKSDGQKLIISYSAQRAKKDAYNRKRGLQKLEKAVAAGRLTKQHLNNKGYNKYLSLEGQMTIRIDYDKFKEDQRWDGLKGYLTNTKLSKELVIESYRQLWFIEKAFRISKTDLRIRPVFHYRKRRIQSHICIAFTAYKLYKELERQLNERNAQISAEKAIHILKTIYSLSIVTPYSETKHTRLLIKTEEQSNLLTMFKLL